MYRRKDLKLRLFLSADMIGSTAFKQNSRGEIDPMRWRETVLEFLMDVPDTLTEFCEELGAPAVPELYKSIGDELVFVVKIEKSYIEVATYIAAFMKMLSMFMSDDDRCSVKGAAWLGSFPLANMEISKEKSIVINVDGENREVLHEMLEYIGPQMDIGFRAARYSTSMKLALTLDLALLLITAKLNGVPAASGMRFAYDGREPLKGVLAERPYPLISILIDGSDELIELRLTDSLPHECASTEDLKDLAALCRKFIKSNEPQLFLPYIVGCDTFNVIPKTHLALLDADN